jgi:MoaA/NifB/PqqE/SkfB family radical SAM enzyme
VRVLTNGIAGAKNIVGDLARAGAKDMSVSIDSLDPVAQEKLEDLPGLLPRKLETIEAILKHLPRGLHIVNAVVTPITLPGLVPLARFARRIGFYASFIPIHLADADSEHHFFSDEPSFRFDPTHRSALRRTYAELLQLRDAGWVFNSRAYLENSLRYLLGEPIDWSCLAGRLYVSVDPTASISICHQFEDAESVPADGFAERYLRGDWREKAERTATPCHACYRPCWAEIDHLALDGEAFFGALRFQARSLWRPARALTREQLAEAARDLAAPATAGPAAVNAVAGVAI